MGDVHAREEREAAASRLMQRRLSNRRAVTWAHALLGGVLALMYISQINLTRYAYWQFGASEALIAITSPTWIPYLISALHSRRVVMSQDGGVLWFIISITLITALVGAVLLGVFGPICQRRSNSDPPSVVIAEVKVTHPS